MKEKQFLETKIVSFLHQHEAGKSVKDIAREIFFDVTISITDFIESFSENTLHISTIEDILRRVSQIQGLIKDPSQNLETL